MRTAFARTLCDLAAEDPRVWLLNADLGYSVLEPFATKFPDRYLNVGVAEQNMIGVAAGLAMSGKVVFTYSIANFATLRCLEQIRNDVCYHGANVKVVAVGGGLTYGPQGYTHHGIEDLAILRSLPNLVVAAPADPIETEIITRQIAARPGPCYLRLGKAGEPVVHSSPPVVSIGKGIAVRDGGDIALLSTGGMLKTCIEAAEAAITCGLAVAVYSFPYVKPLDGELIERLGSTARLVVAVEEAITSGGFGGAVAEVMSSVRRAAPLMRLGVGEGFATDGRAYSQQSARALLGLDAEGIVRAILGRLA